MVAFHNFNGYNSNMHDAVLGASVGAALDIPDIVSFVAGSWDTDTLNTNTLYNHLGAGKSQYHRTNTARQLSCVQSFLHRRLRCGQPSGNWTFSVICSQCCWCFHRRESQKNPRMNDHRLKGTSR